MRTRFESPTPLGPGNAPLHRFGRTWIAWAAACFTWMGCSTSTPPASAPPADEIAPAHVRERPEWITDLLNLGTTTFRKTVTQKSDQLAKRGDNPGTFSTTIPLWMIKLDVFSIPCAWPLKGTVEKIKILV